MEGIIDENTRPEDFEYAEGIAVDIRKWVSDRFCENSSCISFRSVDCKEQFMKVSEKFLAMACKVLVDQNLLTIEGKRIPVYQLTEKAIERLQEENVVKQQEKLEAEKELERLETERLAEAKRQRAEKRKLATLNADDCDSDDENRSPDVNETFHAANKAEQPATKKIDNKSDLLSIRDKPFELLSGANELKIGGGHSLVESQFSTMFSVNNLPVATTVAATSEISCDTKFDSWEVLQLVISKIKENDMVPVDAVFATVQSKMPDITRDTFDKVLQQGEKDNKIMVLGDEVVLV